MELMRIQGCLPDLDTEPLPATVYHYTDTAGLLGIIESGMLWATDYRYLNDSSEIQYIFRLASQIVDEEFLGNYAGIAAAFLEYVVTNSPPYGDTPYYLCCFSELENSLSQWRAYGGRQGFSIAFPGDITRIPGGQAPPKQNPGITLLKVNYDIECQRTYIRKLIGELVNLCQGPHLASYKDEKLAISHITPFYWGQLERASYRFKHPDFSVEHEWRLVAWGIAHSELFRSGVTITPYTRFPLFSHSHPRSSNVKLPLKSVRYGPSALPEATAVALDRLLVSSGYKTDFCERLGSDTPARI